MVLVTPFAILRREVLKHQNPSAERTCMCGCTVSPPPPPRVQGRIFVSDRFYVVWHKRETKDKVPMGGDIQVSGWTGYLGIGVKECGIKNQLSLWEEMLYVFSFALKGLLSL